MWYFGAIPNKKEGRKFSGTEGGKLHKAKLASSPLKPICWGRGRRGQKGPLPYLMKVFPPSLSTCQLG